MEQEILQMLENEKWKILQDKKELGKENNHYEYLMMKEQTYQEIIDMIYEEVLGKTKCQNCNEWVNELGTSELALQDNICENCMEDGYGK